MKIKIKERVAVVFILLCVSVLLGFICTPLYLLGRNVTTEATPKPAEAPYVVKKIVEVKPPSIVDIIPEIRPGVVHIVCPSRQSSGFVVGPNLIVTARHVTKDVENFVITTNDGHKLHATRAISSERHDVAFIYVDDLTCGLMDCEYMYPCGGTVLRGKHKVKLHVLKLGSITDCQLGQEIITIGSPYGKINFNSVTLGIISGLDRDYDPLNQSYYGEHDYGWSVAFQSSASGFPGNSGGAIFTSDGRVVGVLVGRLDSTLIIAMSTDIFIKDLPIIEQMFKQDKYYREVEPDYVAEVRSY